MSSWKFVRAAAVAVAAGGWFSIGSLFGQQTPPQAPVKPEASQSTPSPESQAPETPPPGKVIFSRSLDDSGKEQPGAAAAKQDPVSHPATVPATEAERSSLTFLAYNLDVRLTPKQESIAVRAQITVRNDSDKPLRRIALQLSSTLRWERIKSGATELAFTQQPIDNDADHTGTMNEALVMLPSELAPKQELKLDVLYSGQVGSVC